MLGFGENMEVSYVVMWGKVFLVEGMFSDYRNGGREKKMVKGSF